VSALALLQIPAGPELILLLFLVVSVVTIGLAVGAGYLVYRHADRRNDDSAFLWGIATGGGFLLGFVPGAVVVIAYLLVQE